MPWQSIHVWGCLSVLTVFKKKKEEKKKGGKSRRTTWERGGERNGESACLGRRRVRSSKTVVMMTTTIKDNKQGSHLMLYIVPCLQLSWHSSPRFTNSVRYSHHGQPIAKAWKTNKKVLKRGVVAHSKSHVSEGKKKKRTGGNTWSTVK